MSTPIILLSAYLISVITVFVIIYFDISDRSEIAYWTMMTLLSPILIIALVAIWPFILAEKLREKRDRK